MENKQIEKGQRVSDVETDTPAGYERLYCRTCGYTWCIPLFSFDPHGFWSCCKRCGSDDTYEVFDFRYGKEFGGDL